MSAGSFGEHWVDTPLRLDPASQPLVDAAQADPGFYNHLCQRAAVEKVLIDEPEPVRLRHTDIGIAMHGREIWAGGSHLSP